MQTTRMPPHRGWARCAQLWIALAAACGGGEDAVDRARDEPELPSETDPLERATPKIEVAVNDAATRAPFDATPSPDAKYVYYTALGDETGELVPGVFVVAAGGGQIRTLALGEPLTAPVSIGVSIDGAQLFVSDPAADLVFTLPSGGGAPSPLAGTVGYAPRGLAVARLRDDREYVYFTGRAPDTRAAGVFRVAASGGAVETVAAGDPFSDPAGVAVASDGVAYVVENGSERPSARVLRVENGETSVFIDGIGVGFPAGITLTLDESTMLVSGIDPATQRDVVYYVDTRNKRIARLTDTIGAFREAAGLHRAHEADVFAWADSQANESGTVYVLTP